MVSELKRIRRATMYWKAVQLLAAVAFAVFQVFCTKRYV